MPDPAIDPLAQHRDLIELTVDWHLPDAGKDRRVWLDARKEEAHRRAGVPCAWVALLDGIPVGSVSLVSSNMSTRPDLTPWLAALFVLPEYRGRGVGTALTRRCESEAAISGYRRLYLYTSRARGYYQRLGWLPIGEEEYEGERVILMLREMVAAPKGGIAPLTLVAQLLDVLWRERRPVGVRNSDHPCDLRLRRSWPPARDGQSRPLEGPRGAPAREPQCG